MTRRALVAFFAATASLGAAAQPPDSASIVAVRPVLSKTAVTPASITRAAVVLTVKPGYHVNTNKPGETWLVPTEVVIGPPVGIKVKNIAYPRASKSLQIAGGKAPSPVWEGKVTVTFDLVVAGHVKPGTVTVKGMVRFQPCDDKTCLAPADKPFKLVVPVVKSGTKVADANAGDFAPAPVGAAGGSGGPPSGQSPGNRQGLEKALESRGLFWFLAGLFVAGLGLNLTPCVYPMIAVTMAIFGARAAESRANVLGRAMVYVLGIAAMYTTLGVVAGLTGGLFGAALQSRWVLLFIAVFMFVMAAGMFGKYEMQLPPSVAAKLGGVKRTGITGIFFSGLVVGLFAAPCMGPAIFSLLVEVGRRQSVVFGAASFFTLSLGLGLPYLALASAPGALNRLPRSGGWMEWVKRLFGVVLVAVGVSYLSQAFVPAYGSYVFPVAVVLGGLYLGFVEHNGRKAPGLLIPRMVAGVGGLAFGLWLTFGAVAAQKSLQAQRWPVYSDQALQAALSGGKPAVLDFTASWCAQCHELEARTLNQPGVKKALEPFARFRVELDGRNKPQAAELQKRYGVRGLPAVVFLMPDGSEVEQARVTGFLPPDEFIARVTLARPHGV
jgi:thiol:disulfide interchange protein DsbD